MAVTLGKRRRDEGCGVRAASEVGGVEADERDVFRRHFEARFLPLAKEEPVELTYDDEEVEAEAETDEEEEWDGFAPEDDAVTVVEHNGVVGGSASLLDKLELKSFMTSKPPSTSSAAQSKSARRDTSPSMEEDEDSAANLKNDLALQRLLSESHLLDGATKGAAELDPSGKNRHKALDLRFQSLGSASSIFKQEKMPMSHRKGIANKAKKREEIRRRDAKEAGIVLERKQIVRKERDRRERSVGGPSVGKFRGGMLKLSTRDVADIQGPKHRRSGKKGRR